MDSEIEEDINYKRLSNSRASVTQCRFFCSRRSFPNRSLQDFSGTVARTMEEEQEIQRRLSVLAQSSYSLSYKHLLMPVISNEATDDVDSNNEWKEVGGFM